MFPLYLVSVNSDWDSESSGQSEIRDFDGSVLVDQQILRLQITMNDSVTVKKVYTAQDLPNYVLKTKEKSNITHQVHKKW